MNEQLTLPKCKTYISICLGIYLFDQPSFRAAGVGDSLKDFFQDGISLGSAIKVLICGVPTQRITDISRITGSRQSGDALLY